VQLVVLEDRAGRTRSFPLGPGFWVDGAPVVLAPPARPGPERPTRTASGSVTVHGQRARVARGSRIWVEGRHDAELVEKVWGDDLRVEGVVVEPLHGIDDLPARVAEFGPSADRRLGVLVDHLVAGSKESRLVAEVAAANPGVVRLVGHPYVDVWAAIRPAVVGIRTWPDVPRGTPWKHGALAALGRPAGTDAEVAAGWRWLLAQVRTYADLEPALSGRVEELIDFVTAI
jgi:hypothetical protein